MSSIHNIDGNFIQEMQENKDHVKALQSKSKWVLGPAFVISVVCIVLVATTHGNPLSELAFKVGVVASGVTGLAVLTLITANLMREKIEKNLTSEKYFESLQQSEPDMQKSILEKMTNKEFREFLKHVSSQEEKKAKEALQDQAPSPALNDSLYASLAALHVRLADNLMFIHPTTLTQIKNKISNDRLTNVLNARLMKIAQENHQESFYLYGALSENFGKPHEKSRLKGLVDIHQGPDNWTESFRKEIIIPEMTLLFSNLAFAGADASYMNDCAAPKSNPSDFVYKAHSS